MIGWFFVFFSLVVSLSANVAVAGDAYQKVSHDKIEVLYASEYEVLSKKVLDYELGLIEQYSDSYGFTLDDTQYVGLLSSHNQVANAYSTQIPLNLQMNFPAGALAVDYFSGTSWIKTLLLHESAHNFQLNPKKNPLSYYTHKVVKNSFFTLLLFAPVFPVPNLAESSFMLEGNAVLNESWHNNGGRLYNGALLAMTLTQARAGYITPERTYNNHLYFPYDTHHYIVGGFFHLYLAELYGIDKVNSYFYNFSGQWIPIFTNSVFKETFGKDFEESLAGYNAWLLGKYSGFEASEGKVLFSSKSAVKLNADAQSVYFLISDHLSKPTLIELDKKTGQTKKRKTNHRLGKVFKSKGKYYSLSSAHTSPERVEVGLYDSKGVLKEGSASKAVQSLNNKGEMVYFDIPSSFDEPQMYVDGAFYEQVNSSVYSYHGRHYYFVQEGKTRTLYEDKTALFSYQGWYGFVCDKDENGIYFITNTKNGSGLYRFSSGVISRMSSGDDIVDAKLLTRDSALVETVGAEGLSFREIRLESRVAEVEEITYFFEKDARFDALTFNERAVKSEEYNPLTNLHYASLSQSIMSSGDDVDFDIAVNFTDPLSQNAVRIFSSKFGDDVIAGVGYDSSAYRLSFGASLFGVLDHDKNESSREFGTYLYLSYPLMHNTYEKMDLKLSYLLSSERDEKEPLTLTLDYTKHKYFGHSMYLNSANDFQLSLGVDRDDKAIGGRYHYDSSLGNQFYASFDARGAYSDIAGAARKQGIKVEQYQNRFSDALNFEMASLNSDIYVKELLSAGVSLKKVFDFDKYFFSFPLSLRREALYTKYNYFNMRFLNDAQVDFHEVTMGVKADLLYFNSLALPLSVEYIINEDLKDANNFRVLFNLSF